MSGRQKLLSLELPKVTVIRPGPGAWCPRMPERLDAEEPTGLARRQSSLSARRIDHCASRSPTHKADRKAIPIATSFVAGAAAGHSPALSADALKFTFAGKFIATMPESNWLRRFAGPKKGGAVRDAHSRIRSGSCTLLATLASLRATNAKSVGPDQEDLPA
jgi:hypothetical protein